MTPCLQWASGEKCAISLQADAATRRCTVLEGKLEEVRERFRSGEFVAASSLTAVAPAAPPPPPPRADDDDGGGGDAAADSERRAAEGATADDDSGALFSALIESLG